MVKNALVEGDPPRTQLGELPALPRTLAGQGEGTVDNGGGEGKGKEGTEEEVKRRGGEEGKEGERDKEGRNPKLPLLVRDLLTQSSPGVLPTLSSTT